MKKEFLFVVLCLVGITHVSAQTLPQDGKELVYSQKVTPEGMDNYLFSAYYYSGYKTYNLRGLVISSAPSTVKSLKINPSGTSYAVVYHKKDKSGLVVYNLWKANEVVYNFKDINPTSVCYTPNAKSLLVACTDGIHIYDARTYEQTNLIKSPFTPTQMVVSQNGYYLAASYADRLIVWNLEDKSIRKEYELGTTINDFTFSPDNSLFAILTADGLLTIYDTRMFFIQQSYDAMGDAKHCSFHPEGKYISVVTGDTRMAIQNVMDEGERNYVEISQGGIVDARFLRVPRKGIYLNYLTSNSVIYKIMSALAPNYTKLLTDELNDRMNDWLKMMPGETLEEYKLRVNDETRIQQMKLFEQEIATRMADNLVQMSEVTLGNYNPETSMLAVNFNTMPTIYLNVPADEINSFMDSGNLEFRNSKYGLTKNDKFELIYADVYNKETGKTYVFDNLGRQSLEYLKSDDNFVPLDLVMQSGMEELKLREIKDKIVSLAKQNNTISDHTQINVNAKVVPDYDANGQKILNYEIDFGYEVEKGFSATEDFAPGKYKTTESGAASSMLTIIKTAFENEFAQYVKAGKKLQVDITGMADALPISGKIAYDGTYGDFVDEPVYKDSELGTITVTKAQGVTENEQLAFLRAEGVRQYIDGNVSSFRQMNTNYRHNIELTSGKGGEYRRITVKFTFIDAF